MQNELTFGFVDYFVTGEIRRLPVQFFSAAQRSMVRLDCFGGAPLIVPLEESMRAETVGAVAAVSARYHDEITACLQVESLWQPQPGASTTLMLFRTVHTMRTLQLDVRASMQSVVELDRELRLSEAASAASVAELLSPGSSPSSTMPASLRD